MMSYYLHYKGGLYEKLADAVHSETQEQLVVYQSIEDERIWVRPAKSFYEQIGKTERFRPVETVHELINILREKGLTPTTRHKRKELWPPRLDIAD